MTEKETKFLAQVAMGWFSVDSQGRIWRHARLQGGGVSSLTWKKEPTRAEKSAHGKGSYPRVMFTHDGLRYSVDAHRVSWLVANRRWIPQGMEINHIDGDRTNQSPANLELVTRSQNAAHAIRVIGRKERQQQGEANSSAQLNSEQVLEMRRLWQSKAMTQREIGDRFGVKQTTVNNVVNYHSWKHLP